MNAPFILSGTQLIEAALGMQAAPASPFDGQTTLLVRPDSRSETLAASEREAVAAWLLHQPCPVIALAGADTLKSDPWREIYDVIVESPDEAQTLLKRIAQAPLAAMTLVQTLRVTAHLPVAAALTVESLAYATLQGGPEFRRWQAGRIASPSSSPSCPESSGPAVRLERQGAHLDLALNRPGRRNALSVEMRDALAEALALVISDQTITSVLCHGLGKCFSIGGDQDEFGTAPDPATAHAVRSLRLPGALMAQCGDRIECHLHGACIGAGIELPAFARRVVAAPDTFIQLPEIRFGLIPGAGGCVSLPRRIGRQRTAWLALSARRINARTALAWGLVDAIGGSNELKQ